MRIYEADPSGALQFTGETRIAHTPEGEKLTLEMGAAFEQVRLQELAEMIGGQRITATTRAQAAELLEAARDEFKPVNGSASKPRKLAKR